MGPTIYQRWQKLDILVGNAGILGPLSPLGHVTADAWDEVLDINLTANWRLIRTLDPLLRRSDAGRAIFVSSGAAVSRGAYWGPYAASKAGLEALVVIYATKSRTRRCVPISSIPGPRAPTCAPRPFPGRTRPRSSRRNHVVRRRSSRLAEPACTDNGKLFDLKTGEVR